MRSDSSLNGIDVSHYDGTVNWPAVKAGGISFAFAKASEGETVTDSEFATNWAAMLTAAVPRGAYHFYTTSDDPVAQARHFIATVGAIAGTDLPPMVDIESFAGNYGTATLAVNLQSWLDTVEQAFGRTPIIYTGSAFWNEYMTNQFSKYPLWIAEYDVTAPTLPIGWSNWTFWQNSESGTVGGVACSVDTDIFDGTMQALQAL